MNRRGWLLVLGLLVLSLRPAAAIPALVTGDLNVRAGPSARYPLILGIPRGAVANILGCVGPWCEVAIGRGRSGFVSRYYLDFDAMARARHARPAYRPHRHAARYGQSFGRLHRETRPVRAAPPPALPRIAPPAAAAPKSVAPPTKPPAPAPYAPRTEPWPDQPTGSPQQKPKPPADGSPKEEISL